MAKQDNDLNILSEGIRKHRLPKKPPAYVTTDERNDIENFLIAEGFAHRDYGIMSSRITVIRNYFPDGPSWTGDIFFILWGEANFITVVGKKSGSVDYELMYEINENKLYNLGWAKEGS